MKIITSAKEALISINSTSTAWGLISLFFGLSIISQSLGFVRVPGYIEFIFLPIILYNAMKKRGDNYMTILFFIIYLVLNVIICNPPSEFRSMERCILFCMVLLMTLPIGNSHIMQIFKENTLKIILTTCVVIAVASFFCYFLGINYYRREDDVDVALYNEFVGWFAGLTYHSMVLGPISALSACYLTWRLLLTEKKWLIVLIVLSFGSMALCASRSAFIAGFLGCLVIYYFNSKIKRKNILGNFIKVFFVIAVLSPIWLPYMDRMAQKSIDRNEVSIFESRSGKIASRVEEFKDSPLIGVGFSAQKNIQFINSSSGSIEPGSSWLAVLSMTGIIGFYFFIRFFLLSYRKLRINRHIPESTLYLGVLTFFALHFVGEGYVYAGGNFLCVLFWLCIGVSCGINVRNY